MSKKIALAPRKIVLPQDLSQYRDDELRRNRLQMDKSVSLFSADRTEVLAGAGTGSSLQLDIAPTSMIKLKSIFVQAFFNPAAGGPLVAIDCSFVMTFSAGITLPFTDTPQNLTFLTGGVSSGLNLAFPVGQQKYLCDIELDTGRAPDVYTLIARSHRAGVVNDTYLTILTLEFEQ